MRDLEGILQIEYDDISMKTKLTLYRFGGTFGTLGFFKKPFFNTLSRFVATWDYQPTNSNHVDSLGVYMSEDFLNLGTIDKIHLKCDVIGAL